MDLAALVDDEFVQPLRGAIVADNLIATRQLIESVRLESNITANRDEVKVYAEAYILELRDGEQYKSPPNIEDIKEWVIAKGLDGVLDPWAVLANIQTEGTTWDRKGGSDKLKAIVNPDNVKRIMNIAIDETLNEISTTKWLSL